AAAGAHPLVAADQAEQLGGRAERGAVLALDGLIDLLQPGAAAGDARAGVRRLRDQAGDPLGRRLERFEGADALLWQHLVVEAQEAVLGGRRDDRVGDRAVVLERRKHRVERRRAAGVEAELLRGLHLQ